MMRHLRFGKSGLRVSELCLGAMMFGDKRPFGASREASQAMFDLFAEAGGSFIDTADHYGDGKSEKLIGEFVKADRDNFVVSTKWSVSRDGGIQKSGNNRRNMLLAVERSLARLKTDRIDLYSLHVWDGQTPIDEIMRGLDDLVRSGKVVYVGISDTPAWEISRANMLAELKGWSQFAGIQIEYNLLQRSAEQDLLPMSETLGLAVTAWSPLAGGLLSGKYNSENRKIEPGRGVRSDSIPERSMRIAREVARIAADVGCEPVQVALAWMMRRTSGPAIVPIVGARTVEQLAANLRCVDVALDAPALNALDEVSRIELGFPYEFLKSDYVQNILYGGEIARMDFRRRT